MALMTTPSVTTRWHRFVGCDVGKTEIVVFDSLSGQTTQVANTSAALTAFAATLDAVSLVVCEATGGYEAALLAALTQAGRAVHRADARKVKSFIRSLGTLAKTDALDARALARYGSERHDRLALWQPPDGERVRLQALVQLRHELVRDRTAYANRIAAPTSASTHDRLSRIRNALQAEIEGLEREIQSLIKTHQPLARAAAALQSIAGIGATTAAALLALMPELGSLDRRQVASLAGLAPHPRQSGQANAYRRTRGGRPSLKPVLFMSALSAARYNPTLSAFYNRLVQNGKKPLVALTALMRKLITIANAVVRSNNATS